MSRRKFWLEWVLANAAGEMLGLGLVFVIGIVAGQRFIASTAPGARIVLAALVIVLACFEGVAVGVAQWLVLRRVIPSLTSRAWIFATVAGAVICWLLGMIPSSLAHAAPSSSSPAPPPSQWLIMLAASGMGLVLGLLLSAFQWRVVRGHVERAAMWLPANALAWAVAMPLIFWLVGITVGERVSTATVLDLVLGIAAAGAVVGGIHGAFFVGVMWPRNDAA